MYTKFIGVKKICVNSRETCSRDGCPRNFSTAGCSRLVLRVQHYVRVAVILSSCLR